MAAWKGGRTMPPRTRSGIQFPELSRRLRQMGSVWVTVLALQLRHIRLLGCELTLDEDLGGLCVVIDENCKTSVPHVWAVGDGAGVEGVYVAMAQGKIAAINCLLEEKKISQAIAEKQIADQQKKIRQKRKLVRANKIGCIAFGIWGVFAGY